MISKSSFEILHALEIQTGETQTQWVEDLPLIIKEINKGAKKRVQALKNIDPTPTCDGISCELLNEGDQVYIISDQPRDITNIKLAGNFCGTDLRW